MATWWASVITWLAMFKPHNHGHYFSILQLFLCIAELASLFDHLFQKDLEHVQCTPHHFVPRGGGHAFFLAFNTQDLNKLMCINFMLF